MDPELERRMAQPQRHRLLHGYPMAPLLRRARVDPLAVVEPDPTRPTIVGVLPHTTCNPKVTGCGFCTFPHDKFSKPGVRRVVAQVIREIEGAPVRDPPLLARRIEAIYLGGGTANLTPPDELDRIVAALDRVFDIRGAELTLEGVPAYFLLRDEACLDVVSRAPVAQRRISMGVQTFDASWLARMGRDAFGTRHELGRLVASAHARGFTASADLLFNLPGTDAAFARTDVTTAIALGFDQICVYNLVLTAELDSAWARDPALVAAMPAPKAALATWLAVRDQLLAAGFVQTTLTNFERVPRFVYERASFDPARRDALGFGPGAISTLTSRDRRTAIKWTNEASGETYADAMIAHGRAIATSFTYTDLDLRLLHLTRNLARLVIDREAYRDAFGTDPRDDFAVEIAALEAEGLLDGDALTPAGMFYADAVAGLLAHARVRTLRGDRDDRAARMASMG
jgi:oxygen-independent coproporphyrinogen-3 oxidase